MVWYFYPRRYKARYSPTEIGCIGWFDTQAGQLWPTYLLPLPADVDEENRIQLAQRYELHVGWMNAKSHMSMPLARLLYPPDAFEKLSIDLRCRYVAVYASVEKTTAKSGDTSPREAVAARHGESRVASRPCRSPGDGRKYVTKKRREVPRVPLFPSPRDGDKYVAKKEDGGS